MSVQSQPDRACGAGPIAPGDRIAAIDIVRGVALFGVMSINVTTLFRVSIFERLLSHGVDGTWLDRALYWLLMVAVDLKAYALFSLLFGVGLAIQYDHLSAVSRRTALLVRRLAFLALIGAVHLVFIWNGDILLEYALAGFIVLPFLACRLRTLTMAGTVLLALFVVSSFLPAIASMPSRAWVIDTVARATRIYGSGTFAEILAFRTYELSGFLPLHLSMFPRTVALMLIGAAAWRVGLFRMGSRASRYLPALAAVGLLAGGVVSLSHVNHWLLLGWRAEDLLARLGTALLAGGYGATIVWAVNRAGVVRRLLAWAAPVGRMAFTNYLLQSLIFGVLFYGYGLGLFGKLGVSAALAIGIGVFVLQVVFSDLWLKRCLYGPVEWLWRSAMYGSWQPLWRV